MEIASIRVTDCFGESDGDELRSRWRLGDFASHLVAKVLFGVSAGVGAAIFRNWPLGWFFGVAKVGGRPISKNRKPDPSLIEDVEGGKQFEGVKVARGLLEMK